MTQLGEAFVPIRATLDKLDGDLAAAKGKIDGALGSIGSGVQALGGLALGGIVVGITAIGVALGGIGAISLDVQNDMHQATNAIIVGTGASGEALEDMRQRVISLGGSTHGLNVDLETVGGVMAELNTRLGLTGDGLETATGQVLDFSRLTGSDGVQSVQLITRVMGDWGVENEDVGGTLDMIFGAGQAFGIGVDDLAMKVVQFGAPLRQMGFSLEESIALFGKWEKEGVNAELAIGSLRIAAGNFARDNIPLREGLDATMEAIKGAATESEGLAIAMDVFGARAGPDMAAAIREGRFELDDAIAALQATEGGLAAAADQTIGFREKWQIAMNSARLKLLPIGEMLMDIATRVMPLFEGAFGWFEETLVPIIQEVAEAFGQWFDITLGAVQAGGLEQLFVIFEDGSTRLGALLEIFGMGEAAANNLVVGFLELKDQVVAFLAPIVEAVTGFVSWKDVLMALGVAIASVVIPAIGSILAAVLPVIAVAVGLVALFAVVRNAWENDWGGIRTAVTEAWEQKIKPALEQLWQWLKVNIPIALETLKGFWENVLLPAIQNVWSWISGTLIPFLSGTVVPILETVLTVALQALADYWTEILWPAIQNVWAWISGTLIPFITGTLVPTIDTILTVALTTLADFWENVLLPAIETVWAFIRDDLVPLFEAVRELVAVAMTLALTALQGAWENILLPALEVVWEFIQENLVPIIERLIEVLGPPIQTVLEVVKGLFDGFKAALDGVKGIIQEVIGWIGTLTEALGNITLPDVLTPGSPTPFELGLRGIVGAMRDMNQLLPELERRLQMGGLRWAASVSAEGLASPSAGSGVGDTYHLTLAGAAGESRGLMRDFAMLKWLAGTD